MSRDIKIINYALQRNLFIQLAICSVLIGLGIFLLMYEEEEGFKNLVYIVRTAGVIFMCLGVFFALQAMKITKSDRRTVKDILTREPQKIVWIYHYIVINKPYGVEFLKMTTIYFNLVDGKRIGLMIPENKAELLMNLLRLRLPHATFGYSEKKEFLYKANPYLLLKS